MQWHRLWLLALVCGCATVSGQDVLLRWQAPTACTDGSTQLSLAYFNIYRGLGDDTEQLPVSPTAAAREYLLTDQLSAEIPERCYRMTAVGQCPAGGGESAFSNTHCVEFDGTLPPGSVQNLRIAWIEPDPGPGPDPDPPPGGGGSVPAVVESHTPTIVNTVQASVDAAKPATVNAGDMLLALITNSSNDSAQNYPAPSSDPYTRELQTTPGGGQKVAAAMARIATGDEGGGAQTFTADFAGRWIADIIRLSGADGVHATAYNAAVFGTTAESPSVTTTVDDCLIIVGMVSGGGGPADGNTLTPPADTDPIFDEFNSNPMRLIARSFVQSTAGDTPVKTWTFDGSDGFIYPFTIAIAPAAATGEEASIGESGDAAAAFAATVHQAAELTAALASADQYAPVAHVAVDLVAAAVAASVQGDETAALGELVAGLTGDAQLDALSQAAAALIAAGSAGESWIAGIEGLATLIAAGAASETITAAAADAQARAIEADGDAAAAFVAAVATLGELLGDVTAADTFDAEPTVEGEASLEIAGDAAAELTAQVDGAGEITGAGSAVAALVAVVAAFEAISSAADATAELTAVAGFAAQRSINESGDAAAAWAATAALTAHLAETLDAGATWSARAATDAAITEAAAASSAFAARLAESGYLVAGAISFVAALSGEIHIEPALVGSVRVEPAE